MRNLGKARAKMRPPRPWRSLDESRTICRYVFLWYTGRGQKPSGREWAGNHLVLNSRSIQAISDLTALRRRRADTSCDFRPKRVIRAVQSRKEGLRCRIWFHKSFENLSKKLGNMFSEAPEGVGYIALYVDRIYVKANSLNI